MHRNHWRRQIALEDAQRWECARIFHFVNGLDWTRARYFARVISLEEAHQVLKTHPNWEKERLCSLQ